jgi:hypothetical protein
MDNVCIESLALRLGADARARRVHSPACAELRREFQNLYETAESRSGARDDPAGAFADRVDVVENMLVDGSARCTGRAQVGTT